MLRISIATAILSQGGLAQGAKDTLIQKRVNKNLSLTEVVDMDKRWILLIASQIA
jgi:hypothetical protein